MFSNLLDLIDAWSSFEHHVMITTRGTRGDVQPFLALARGLAETYGWLVTIVTELNYIDFIKIYSTVTFLTNCLYSQVLGIKRNDQI